MRPKFILLFVMLLVSFLSVKAQIVHEAESQIVLRNTSAEVSLMVENPNKPFAGRIDLELLDAESVVRAQTSQERQIKTGKETYTALLPLVDLLKTAGDDIVWYRLHYRVGGAAGVISLSQIVRDNFELRVVASNDLFAGITYRIRILAADPFTNKPVAGVKFDVEVKLDLKGDEDKALKLTSSGETGADGSALLDLQIPPEAELDNDGEITVTGRKNGVVREATDELRTIGNDSNFLILTDKPIYQPEQDLNIRGILLKGVENRSAVAATDLEFRILDGDDTVLYRETVKTSEFGVASISWKIPENAKLGDYSIKVRNLKDPDGQYLGYQSVKISRYDLPNFSVTAKPDKTYYLPAEKQAEIEVQADYLFGKPVARGKVRIVRENNREWNWKEQKYEIDEGESHEGKTDGEGKFTAKFDLSEAHEDLKEDDWQKFTDLHFTAYFTDLTTNRTEQRRFDVRVTKEPIHVYFVGRRYGKNAHLPVSAYVSTFYADGTPAICDVEVKGSEEDEDKFKTLQRSKTNSFGAGKLEFMRPNFDDDDETDMDLKIIAKDAKGNKGTFAGDIGFEEGDELQIEAEKTIYKPGESIKISVVSTKKTGLVYVDVVHDWSVVNSYSLKLENGKAEVEVPYQPVFQGELKIAAYLENENERLIEASRGVVFPTPQNLKLNADFNKQTYKPSEEGTISFGVWDSVGKSVESALGVVIFDKAIEERARTDSEFSGGMFNSFRGWLGYGGNFGGVNIKDINELDLSKPIPDELQLVAEVILHDNYYSPNIFHSRSYAQDAKSVYAGYFKTQFAAVEKALNTHYENNNFAHPTDEASLRQILAQGGIDLDGLRDPWQQNYRLSFEINKNRDLVQFVSAGADKTFGTKDDLNVSNTNFIYFKPEGNKIDQMIKDFHARTGGYIRDEKTLFQELGVTELKDRFGRPYRIIFDVSGRYYRMRIHSLGKDGVFSEYTWQDDFDIWTNLTDYFKEIDLKIEKALQPAKNFPEDERQFRAALLLNDIDLEKVRDGYGQQIYVTVQEFSRYQDRVSVEDTRKFGEEKDIQRTVITPVTQQVRQFTLRSRGADGRENTPDDFTLTQVVRIISEQTKDDPDPQPSIKKIVFTGGTGAIGGTITDANGAVVPNATIKATNSDSGQNQTATADSDGKYLIANLAVGTYSVRVSSTGFKDSVRDSVPVTANGTTKVDFTLSAGNIEETVTVTADAAVVNSTNNTTGSSITQRQITELPINGRRISGSRVNIVTKSGVDENQDTGDLKSTPRLREYFPETLIWSPELVTDKNGKAELRFKLADNITTWKLYTIASTKNGKIGVAEKEITAFQPFFVDLEPPKFLTAGDEIHLPVTVRNYTESKQQVSVSMAKGDWFNFLDQPERQIEVAAGSAKNAVFGFKAMSPVKSGKQRVTAIAQKDSDAIEKPVTVRPNGQEVVKTASKFFSGAANFDVNFPANALPQTQKAELKIYPNLMAHVSEAVEGLLQRPYGCGEQTISSTYPNLMILKFTKGENKLRRTAQKYLQKGYERLLGYQVSDGGFSYWGGKDTADIALTAYAIRFLNDAAGHIAVDEEVIKKAQEWLVKQQRADGSWTKQYSWEKTEDTKRTKLFTSYAARALAMSKQKDTAPLQKALAYLKTRSKEIDDPYSLALLGLALADAGDLDGANGISDRLEKLSIAEGDAAYWNLETNTPFYGWGTAGRIETTALVTQLLTKLKTEDHPNKELLSRAMIFLLKNKDRYGVWYSTQTTINVLDAFLATLKTDESGSTGAETIRVILNGAEVRNIAVPANQIEPMIVDLTDKLTAAENRVEIKTSANTPLMSQLVSAHYIDWKDSQVHQTDTNGSRTLRFAYTCDKQNAAIMQEINCSAQAERVGFQGYGMLLMEIGTPPGADVSRESLEKAMEADWSLSRYDILPDRIVIYMWAKAGGTKFNFSFRPRYGIDAQTPASIVYDYYNPEAQALVTPLKFSVK